MHYTRPFGTVTASKLVWPFLYRGPGHPHRVHHGLELGRLLPLAACNMDGQW
jgi:hypothetical protein